MLHGGVDTRCITEFCGPPNCGKTQMCHSLAVAAQLDGQKVTGSLVLYIDTEQTFNPVRIFEIAARRRLDEDQVLANVLITRANSVAKQEQILEQIPDLCKSNNIILLIIDSVIRNYRAKFTGRSNLVERQQRVCKFMHALSNLAVKHDIAVVITNQVSDRPESSGKYKPTGGNILGHFVTHRISLIERGPVILANLVKSAYYPYTDCRLQIEDIGVTDAVEF
jgi:meiotic recombination protein DMC1